MPVMSIHFPLFHLKIGNGGFQLGVPINKTFGFIDQILFIQLDKNL